MTVNTRKSFEPAVWHHLYHRIDPTPSQQLFRRVTEEIALLAQPLIDPGSLWLDLGCGTGELSRRLAQAGADVVSTDLDPDMLQWSRQHTSVELGVVSLGASASGLPLADASVDGIVAASLTGCLEDLAPFWAELSRVLVPGGHAVLSFTNKHSLFLALTSQWRRLKTLKDTNHPCHGVFQRYSRQDVTDAAGVCGLQPVETRYFNGFADFEKWSLPPIRVARKLEAYSPEPVLHRSCRNFVMIFRNTKMPVPSQNAGV